MANKWFLYDDDARTTLSRKFNVTENAYVLLKASDLTDPVQIYVSVGECVACDNDFAWEPLTLCGNPVELSADNSMLIITTPGMYYLGDPTIDPLALGATTNVTAEIVTEVPVELSGGCEAPVIGTDCDNAMFVKLCESFQVELSAVKLGCAIDAGGEAIGAVMFVKEVDETTGVATQVLNAVLYDGSIVSPYTGEWGVCKEDPCESETVLGVITDMSLLTQ